MGAAAAAAAPTLLRRDDFRCESLGLGDVFLVGMALHEKEEFAFTEEAFVRDRHPPLEKGLSQKPDRVAFLESRGEKGYSSTIARGFKPIGEQSYRRMDIVIARRVDGAAHEDDVSIDGGRILLRLSRLASCRFRDGGGNFSGIPRCAVKNDIGFHAAIISYYWDERDGYSLCETPFLGTMVLIARKVAMRRLTLIFGLVFISGLSFAAAAGGEAQNALALIGTWQGSLKVGAVSLRIAFNVGMKEGALSATMDSLDQGARGIPVSKVALVDSVVTFEVKTISGIFEGKFSADGSRIDGNWKQGGGTFPLALLRMVKGQDPTPGSVSNSMAPAGSQEPAMPYPYETIDVEFPNSKAGIRLSGTLTIPKGSGPFPAIVLVTGSGPQNRDEEVIGHKPFLVIADYLARRGIAALRYDDRGVGGSGGSFSSATTFDFTDDALAAAAFLAGSQRIDAKRVGIVGHSEGAIVAAIAATRDKDLSFIVMLAGPGVRGDKLLLMQNEALAKASGVNAAAISEAKSINAELYGIAMRAGTVAELKAEIISTLKAKASGGKGELSGNSIDAEAGRIADQLLSPWMRSFLSIDPASYLSTIKIPVLAMNGSKDLQVPAEENLKAIGAALSVAGNSHFKILELNGLNHLFQYAVTGLPDEYGSIVETFAPEALSALGDWIESTIPGGMHGAK